MFIPSVCGASRMDGWRERPGRAVLPPVVV